MTRAARLLLALLALLVAVAAVLLQPTGASAAERTVTYTVSSRGGVAADLGQFAAVAREALTDGRGWSLGGTLAFQQVGSGSDFDLILASPSVIANASPGCSAQWSCRVGRTVYINDDRWRFGTDAWPHGVALYQRYVILHEVGHWIGIPHTDCPTPGRTAWVMQQQSISLQGCRANVWPVIPEREQAGRRMGVSVHWSAIDWKYITLGQAGGVLGAPVTWEQRTARRDGAFQHFTGGSIFWSPSTGAYETYGGIRGRWAALGWELGVLGYPTTGELGTADGVGRYQHFTGGSIFWSPSTGAHEAYGGIRGRWAALGWERGVLGYPTTGELGTADGVGRYQHFTGGSIFWSPSTGAHETYGGIRARWAALGWERSELGYPTSGEYDIEGGRRSDFQHGYITWDRSTGRTDVRLTG